MSIASHMQQHERSKCVALVLRICSNTSDPKASSPATNNQHDALPLVLGCCNNTLSMYNHDIISIPCPGTTVLVVAELESDLSIASHIPQHTNNQHDALPLIGVGSWKWAAIICGPLPVLFLILLGTLSLEKERNSGTSTDSKVGSKRLWVQVLLASYARTTIHQAES
jgi:hypothetical protein